MDKSDLDAVRAALKLVKSRYESRPSWNLTGSIQLSYDEAPQIIAALEAATQPAVGDGWKDSLTLDKRWAAEAAASPAPVGKHEP